MGTSTTWMKIALLVCVFTLNLHCPNDFKFYCGDATTGSQKIEISNKTLSVHLSLSLQLPKVGR